jgi:site-specific DNA-methyltransferase (adenine-specific)
MLDLQNIDCMELMANYPDAYFDLAIVDPPYGLGDKLKPRGGMIGKSFDGLGGESWDIKPPSAEYFAELKRVSKNQIIWGGNYFIDNLTPTQCFLIWDKMNGTNPMADCEFAWTSIKNKVARIFRMHHFSDGYDDKIHPTQKPRKLYDWILHNFAEEGMKILDTHLGSGTIAISCHYKGFDLVGSEINTTYYNTMMKFVEMKTAQTSLF